MKYANVVTFKVYGKYALFTDPITKIGGEKCTYQIPTYEALKGVLSSVYWKPTFIWFIDKMRVMKSIRTQTRSAKPLIYGGQGHDLSIYTYLADVEYQVQAHFDWNYNREDLQNDRNEHKHWDIAKRMIQRGGRRDVFLGTRECQAYVEPCEFGESEGFYDNYPGELSFGMMFHGFNYPDELGKDKLQARFWFPKMEKGIVEFIQPGDCDPKLVKFVRVMEAAPPDSIGLQEEGLFG